MYSVRYRLLMAGALMLLSNAPALADNLTPDLQMHGFMTAGLARLSNDQGNLYGNPNSGLNGGSSIGRDTSAEFDSVAGLQFNYKLSEQTDMVTQLLATGNNSQQQPQQSNFNVKANLAYLVYHLNDEWSVRAGRFALPVYLYSENLHVGAAYPWARLPTEIYQSLGGFYNENGVNLLYRHAFGDWTLSVQPSLGEEQLNSININNLRGLAVDFSNDVLTLHAGSTYAYANFNLGTSVVPNLEASVDPVYAGDPSQIPAVNQQISARVSLQKSRSSYSDIGLLYDDGTWFAASELAELRLAGWLSDYNSGYISVGHYAGKWLPFVLYGRMKTVNNDERASFNLPDPTGFPPGSGAAIGAPLTAALTTSSQRDQSTLAVGARYQLKQNVSLKVQADRIYGFHGTPGLFVPLPTSAAPTAAVYLYSISLNATF
jgi:hypothetical protein